MTNVAPVAIPILEARAWSRSFDNTQALDDADFDINLGEVVVFTGDNGAAKSTRVKPRQWQPLGPEKA